VTGIVDAGSKRLVSRDQSIPAADLPGIFSARQGEFTFQDSPRHHQ
jgi:hypothetical protein